MSDPIEDSVGNSSSDNGNDGSNISGISALHDLIAGGVAGSASVIVGHPFDTIKVRMQTSAPPSSSGSGTGRAMGSPGGGFLSLFRGMAAPLTAAAAVNATIFATYGSSLRLWEDVFESPASLKSEFVSEASAATIATTSSSIDPNPWKIFACGCAAGTVQAFIICPVEHVKCRLQVQAAAMAMAAEGAVGAATMTAGATTAATSRAFSTSTATTIPYLGPYDCASRIVRSHGIFSGLYRGMGVTLWREVPAFGLYFSTYDAVKTRVNSLLQEYEDHSANPLPPSAHAWAASALAGGLSGAWTWAVIYPFDVIKSRMQTGPLEMEQRRGMWVMGRDLAREHGWRFLFRGLGVTLVRAFPVNAIIFPVYEFTLIELQGREA